MVWHQLNVILKIEPDTHIGIREGVAGELQPPPIVEQKFAIFRQFS